MKNINRFLILTILLSVFATGYQKDQLELPKKMDLKYFDEMKSNEKENIINGLNNDDKYRLLKIILPGRGLGSEWGEIKFFKDGEFIYDFIVDPEGMGGGNPGDKKYKYFIGKWEINNNILHLTNINKIKEIDFIEDKEKWIDVSADAYPNGDLYLNFKVDRKTSKKLLKEKSFMYLTEFESAAIEDYSLKKQGNK